MTLKKTSGRDEPDPMVTIAIETAEKAANALISLMQAQTAIAQYGGSGRCTVEQNRLDVDEEEGRYRVVEWSRTLVDLAEGVSEYRSAHPAR